MPSPAFTPISSQLAFGPPTDISMGWDGTLWAIDGSGAPHLFDPARKVWQLHGNGIAAAAWVGTTYYFFRGGEVVKAEYYQNTGRPQSIAALFPDLPDSFKLGVTGAVNNKGKLILFKGGWYLPADGSAPRAKLTDVGNWPTTPNWVDGVIDACWSYGTAQCVLLRGAEYILVDLDAKAIISGPFPNTDLQQWRGHIPPDWLAGGIDAAFTQMIDGATVYTVFRGPAMVEFHPTDTGIAAQKYLAAKYPEWPPVWNPRLRHAPSGRMGNLWCATTSQAIVQHDGENWSAIAGKSASVAVGQDNSIFVVSGDDQTIDTWVAGTGWVATAKAPKPLTQVAVGDTKRVFALGSDGSVHCLVGSSGAYAYTPVDLGTGVPNPTHMAANADGTLWHCNSSDVNAYRFISEATAASAAISVQEGRVTGVQKVASTGFGVAHCLVTENGEPNVYRYDSPYVFKTSQPYVVRGNAPLAQGLGRLYFVQQVDYLEPRQLHARFVALDAHTGQEVASYAPASDTIEYTGLVFDSINDLLYVGAAPVGDYYNNTALGQLIALDARTLQVRWTYRTKAGIDSIPALRGTQLCVGDRTATVYMFDTRDALANAAAPEPTWMQTITNWQGLKEPTTQRAATPVFRNGLVHAVAWGLWSPTANSDTGAWLIASRCNARDGGSQEIEASIPASSPVIDLAALDSYASAPVLGTASFDGNAGPVLFVAGGNAVYAVSLESTGPSCSSFALPPSFTLPSGRISTELVYDDGTRAGTGLSSTGVSPDTTRLWFGDNQGNLWSLNNALQPVDGSPRNLVPHTGIWTTPVLYKDPQGGLTVLFGVVQQPGSPISARVLSLYGYDPDSGNHAGVSTGVTAIWSLCASVTNGVVYAAGGGNATPDGQVSQVFGIRVDELPQALRDFIIESQLMQDPDPDAQGGSTDPDNPIPPSVARYQTHLTVVDDVKAPVPHEPVKIWADQPDTRIVVGGRSFTIGPGDAEFASVTTGVDGSLVIVSNATDLFASPLRVWASFMDPYERIAVNPDQEFHARVTTAHANAGDDDPDKVNLQTAHDYNGASLFTDQEKSQGQPRNCADAVAQMNKGVGLSGGASQATFAKVMQAATGRGFTVGVDDEAQAEKYLAYADLTGASHFPANIPAARPIAIAQPVGAAYWCSDPRKSGQIGTAPAFVALSAADACDAIDALTGAPWQPEQKLPSPAGGPLRVGSIFTDFWSWLKGAAADITHIIVAVAEDVVVGIRLIVNGVEQVFKAVIKVIEDIAAAIGSFFQMLKKLIEDVIAAVSVLFHFGEIIHTHQWIRDQINANLQQFAHAMQTQVKPPVDRFFEQGEQTITTLFRGIRQQLGITDDTRINSVNSAQSTAHTAFTVGPNSVGPNSGGSSHAVQCTHTTQKMKEGLPAAQPASGAAAGMQVVAGDDDTVLSTFVTDFTNSLQNDPAISSAFAQLKRAISNIGQSRSAGDFFESALNLLLTLVEDLILGMVAVTHALMDGLIDAIQALMDTVLGLLNTPVNIPFLSWLYRLLFGEPLTILNAVSLVAAIPVTIIYRVVEGRYPSQDGITGAAVRGAALTQTMPAAVTVDVAKKMQGLIGGVIALGLGVARGVVDAAGEDPPPIGTIFVAAFGMLYASTYFPGVSTTADQWATWGLGVALAALGTFGVINLEKVKDETKKIFKGAQAIFRVGLAVARFVVFSVAFGESSNRKPVTNVQFARNLFLELPPMFNWLKFLPKPASVVLTVIDVVTGVVVCALNITAAFLPANANVAYARAGHGVR